MEKEQEVVRTSLRMNRRLYELLAEAAQKRGLTMHAEIIARLESTFDERPKNDAPVLTPELFDQLFDRFDTIEAKLDKKR